MQEDASYYALISSVQPQEERLQTTKHQRKASLLAQPNEGSQANDRLIGGHSAVREKVESREPPKATLSRRAQSYTDFHRAVKTTLGSGSLPAKVRSRKSDQEIKNGWKFEEWYQTLEEELLEASHDEYKVYQEQLRFSESYLESLASETSVTLDILTSISWSFKRVEDQAAAFGKQCEDLMKEQQRITQLADDMGQNLQYYNYLEPITRRLNAPGAASLVRSRDFSNMLARLDECLLYMSAHMFQREAPMYRSRYRLLLTRGLTLIRLHFVGALRDIAQDVTRRIADRQLNDTTMSALLYAKFRVSAPELKELSQEIRKRAVVPDGSEPGAEAEYQSLINELYTSYSATRGKLVIPLIRKKIAEIALAPSTSKDLVAFARNSISYIRSTCTDEYMLWREWFEGEEALYDFLESVCEPLYDYLRPRIIHESQLLKLCELCTLLQTRYLRDQDEEPEAALPNQLDFSTLIQAALEDAQTRLVFRTQVILRDEIESYKPKPEDLEYPARNAQAIISTQTSEPVTSGTKGAPVGVTTAVLKDAMAAESEWSNEHYGYDLETSFRGWYPTLRKAIWLLSRIYRLVNSTVFDDLAHEIVHHTTLSLHRASSLLKTRASAVDGQLFLLKHLLSLKQQIVAFDIEYVTPDVSFDFSGVTNTFYELRERGGLFDPRNLWRLIGRGLLPRVVENMLDAKAELDGRLRTLINDFTTGFAEIMTGGISGSATSKKNFNAATAFVKMKQATAQNVISLRRKLDEYLDDVRVKETLVDAVQEQVIQDYEKFFVHYTTEKKRTGKVASKRGKEGEEEIWDMDMFATWATEVFGAGRVELTDVENGHGSRSLSVSADGSQTRSE